MGKGFSQILLGLAAFFSNDVFATTLEELMPHGGIALCKNAVIKVASSSREKNKKSATKPARRKFSGARSMGEIHDQREGTQWGATPGDLRGLTGTPLYEDGTGTKTFVSQDMIVHFTPDAGVRTRKLVRQSPGSPNPFDSTGAETN